MYVVEFQFDSPTLKIIFLLKVHFFLDFEYSSGDKGVSFDGDADRIVYFYKDSGMIFVSCFPIELPISCLDLASVIDGEIRWHIHSSKVAI